MKNGFEIRGDITALFVITKGQKLETIISTSDLDKVKSISGTWNAQWNIYIKKYYIITTKLENGKRKRIQLHRFIMDTPQTLEVDHINRDTLNNTRFNLRNVTRSENLKNRSPFSTNKIGKPKENHKYKSGVRGVNWVENRKRWIVRPMINNKLHYLGYFKNLEEAEKVANSFFNEHNKIIENFHSVW